MLIVYQSLESTGTKDQVPSTFITGNSFKRRVHGSLQQGTAFYKSRVWDGDKIKFETTKLTMPFASPEQSEELSRAIKKLDSDGQNKMAIAILTKIVERIVDNASACTRPASHIAPFVRCPDVIVLGEMYAKSLDGQVLYPFSEHKGELKYVVLGGIDPTGDARHRFTVLIRTGFDGKRPDPRYDDHVEPLLSVVSDKSNKDEDSKCMLMKVRGWLIAFVHTPNNICNDPERAAEYLHNNAQRFGKGSTLDLVMGDTNQSTSDTVKRYMNGVYNQSTKMEIESWDHSVMPNKKQVIRGYTNYEVSGTNSQYDKHFDIACTQEAHVSLVGLTAHATKDDDLTHEFPPADQHPAFVFHGLTDKFVELDGTFYAYSDHNGVIVEVLRDKPEHASRIERKRRDRLIDDFRRSRE
jgi:hypothetical protein